MNVNCPNCQATIQAVRGHIELANGTTTKWLEFVDGKLTLAEAKAEAIRIKEERWKGCVVRCWCD